MKTHKTPQEAATLLNEIQELLELKGENPFKIRAFERAAHQIINQDDLDTIAKEGRLTELPGVGKGIAEILSEFILKGTCGAKEELLASLPEGLIAFTKIPGLGAKKASQIIEHLKIHNLEELETACRENRLFKIKGFSEKTQKTILDGIQFLKGGFGKQRLGDALPQAKKILEVIKTCLNMDRHPLAGELQASETGALRRRLEVLDKLEYLVELPPGKQLRSLLLKNINKEIELIRTEQTSEKYWLPIKIHETSPDCFVYDLAKTTGSATHWEKLGSPENSLIKVPPKTEAEFYGALRLPFIPPEMREGGDEVKLAREEKIHEVLPEDGVQGIFHAHTTRSDGSGSLEEMVLAARNAGYKYIGISDHSQSAFYANGLKEDDLLTQEKEIRIIQEKYPEIRIFWGIESDILADGSLDYDSKILKRFDFVIASIHSRFKMDKKQMTDRIVKAIHHPSTRFVGHLTGRLLLERESFDVDFEKIISEAAICDVAIEINAHPMRLDIDWRHGGLLRQYKTKVSINPDAHATQEVTNTQFGVTVARKALIPKTSVVNSWNSAEVEQWLKRKKK